MTERFAWVDLAAGPFTWGPAVGGEGVRSYSSLPDFTAAWQGPTEDLGLGAPGLEGDADGAGPSVAELEAERTLLYEVTLPLPLLLPLPLPLTLPRTLTLSRRSSAS